MENQNKQRGVERELKELVQRYNVLYKSQLYAFFQKDGRDRFVGRALKNLEKEHSIFISQETKQEASGIVFVGDGEIYDILYVAPEDVELTNQLFARRKIDACGHIVVVEETEDIPKIQIPDVIGYCTVKEEGQIEYYRKDSQ